jgi:hypothetical protein
MRRDPEATLDGLLPDTEYAWYLLLRPDSGAVLRVPEEDHNVLRTLPALDGQLPTTPVPRESAKPVPVGEGSGDPADGEPPGGGGVTVHVVRPVDLNGDGRFDQHDVEFLLSFLYSAEPAECANCDVDRDGLIGLGDALQLLKVLGSSSSP